MLQSPCKINALLLQGVIEEHKSNLCTWRNNKEKCPRLGDRWGVACQSIRGLPGRSSIIPAGSRVIERGNCSHSTPVLECVWKEVRGRRLTKLRLKLHERVLLADWKAWTACVHITSWSYGEKSKQGFVKMGYLASINPRQSPNKWIPRSTWEWQSISVIKPPRGDIWEVHISWSRG